MTLGGGANALVGTGPATMRLDAFVGPSFTSSLGKVGSSESWL